MRFKEQLTFCLTMNFEDESFREVRQFLITAFASAQDFSLVTFCSGSSICADCTAAFLRSYRVRSSDNWEIFSMTLANLERDHAQPETFWLRLKCTCGVRLKAPPKAVGRTLPCPGCGAAIFCPRELLPLKALPEPDFGLGVAQQLSVASAVVEITRFNLSLMAAAGWQMGWHVCRRDGLRELRRLHSMLVDDAKSPPPPCPLERLALANHPCPPTTRWVPQDPQEHAVEIARQKIREMMDELSACQSAEEENHTYLRKPR